MKDIFSVFKEKRWIARMVIAGVLFLACAASFRMMLSLVPGMTEVRPANMIPVVFGILWGPAAAWGISIANAISDILVSHSPVQVWLPGFFINFFYAYLPYKMWYSIDYKRNGIVKPRLGKVYDILKFIWICFVDSLVTTVLLALLFEYLGFQSYSSSAVLLFFNNFDFAVVLGIPVILVFTSRREAKFWIPPMRVMEEQDEKAASNYKLFTLFDLLLFLVAASGVVYYLYSKITGFVIEKNAELVILVAFLFVEILYIRRPFGIYRKTRFRVNIREMSIRAKVVLGSATPSLEAYYRAKQGKYALYTMTKRARGSALPDVEIVDMREELRNGNRSVISQSLKEAMTEKLQAKEQMMLFLNRRGYAGFLSCRSCGHVLMCPHCDVSLSVHNHGRMVCHYCGYEEKKPVVCPKCGSTFISTFGTGTQQVEQVVKKMFPEAGVLRMDMDTTREKDGHEKILAAFQNQEADILIGTQMIVKGHDFPNVTLVGILAADLSLYAQDYKAGERTFQLLTQAAGRAGRGEKSGNVIIQSYDPEHYCITAASRQDYCGFYEEEMSYRMLAGYPPAVYMMSLHGTGKDEAHLQTAMDYLVKMMQRMPESARIRVLGPTAESIGKIQDEYRKVIYIKGEDLQILTGIKNKLEKYIKMNEGYRTVQIQFDLEN